METACQRESLATGDGDSLPEVLAVVLLRPAVADLASKCGTVNVSYHRKRTRGRSWYAKEPLETCD